MSRCPICGEESAEKVANSPFPFCSARCKLVDLGNWLGERYRTPVREELPASAGDSESGDPTVH